MIKALPDSLQQLVTALSRLPGIGRKTATRLAFHLLNSPEEEGAELAAAIQRVKQEIRLCEQCHHFTEARLCTICSDDRRDTRTICVVEDSQNITLIEKTNEYRGRYHVLGGVISPLDGIGPEELHIKTLLPRLTEVEEIILALSPSTEGEATSIYLARLIQPHNIRITRLARGIPLGSSLEFVDELTLGKAFQARHEIS